MAAEDTKDIVLDLEETPKEPEIKVEKVEDASAVDPSVAEALDGLKRELADAKAQKAEAERRAGEADSRAHQALTHAEETDLQLITNAIGTIQGNNTILKQQFSQALAAGDYDAVADVQEKIALNAAHLQRLKEGKEAMEAAPKREAPRQHPVDRVEALAAQLKPASADWVRRHPEYAQDDRLYRKMIRAHEDAIDDGLTADTPDYFASIESRLGIQDQRPPARTDDGDATDGAAKVVARRASPAAAPVSRQPPSPTRPNTVRLSAEEREIAAMNGMSDQEYARQKLRIQQERTH